MTNTVALADHRHMKARLLTSLGLVASLTALASCSPRHVQNVGTTARCKSDVRAPRTFVTVHLTGHATPVVNLKVGWGLVVIGPPPLNIPDPRPFYYPSGIVCQLGGAQKLATGTQAKYVAIGAGQAEIGASDYHGGPTNDIAWYATVRVGEP
jgi:hypothetical protein